MPGFSGPGLSGSLTQSLLLLIAVAVAARAAYELLAPLLPALVVLVLLGLILASVLRR